jgi:hypothetical protein
MITFVTQGGEHRRSLVICFHKALALCLKEDESCVSTGPAHSH